MATKSAKKTLAGKTAAKKTQAKKAPAKKAAASKRAAAAKPPSAKSAAKKYSANKPAAKKASAKTASANRSKSSASTSKSKSSAASDNYTDPALRARLKDEVMAGDKGGRPGQWSARKAQLLVHEYEAKGGGYKHPRDEGQQHLKDWGDEHWHTADGKQAIQGDETHRYLPDKAWDKLSTAEKRATDKKKVAGSKTGKQFVANTKTASKARKSAKNARAVRTRSAPAPAHPA